MKKNAHLLLATITILSMTSHCLQATPLKSSDNVRIEFQPNRKAKETRTGSVGAKVATFRPILKITNSSIKNFPGLECCVMMLGQDTQDRNNWSVLMKQVFKFDLPASETHTWEGPEFSQEFDHIMAKSGFDYDGFIVLIKNSEGKIAVSKATKTFWIQNPETAWNLKKGKSYKRSDFN